MLTPQCLSKPTDLLNYIKNLLMWMLSIFYVPQLILKINLVKIVSQQYNDGVHVWVLFSVKMSLNGL